MHSMQEGYPCFPGPVSYYNMPLGVPFCRKQSMALQLAEAAGLRGDLPDAHHWGRAAPAAAAAAAAAAETGTRRPDSVGEPGRRLQSFAFPQPRLSLGCFFCFFQALFIVAVVG